MIYNLTVQCDPEDDGFPFGSLSEVFIVIVSSGLLIMGLYLFPDSVQLLYDSNSS